VVNKFYYFLPVLLVLLLLQALWIFFDARKRREKGYWLWGLFGLLNVPSSLIIYLLITRNFDTREKESCPECGLKLKNDWNYCPGCSREIKK